MSTWRPRFRFSSAHARDLLGFSSGVFLSNLGGLLNRRADALLMGIFFGPVAVGLYRLADRFSDNVLELTMRPVGHVVAAVLLAAPERPAGAQRTRWLPASGRRSS